MTTNLSFSSGDKVMLVGKNGSGKTTFLNYIKEQIPNNFKVAYFEQNNLEIFKKEETVLNFIRNITDIEEKELRNILALLNFRGTDINKKVSVLSNGEKVKLYFISLLFQETDVLLLDELTNFLDIVTIEAVEKILSKYPGILIMVSHDSQFVKNVATKVIELNSKEILRFR
ncbi:ATP-binding cassette domain-containing protein [Gemella morbillorum]|nr:ATP-binding cassette domain-containing protein [Gemella morbillorum]